MSVSEEAPVGTTVGKVFAEDSDIGENAAMNYSIEGDSSDVFDIITDNETQEGIILLRKVRTQKFSKKSLNIGKNFLRQVGYLKIAYCRNSTVFPFFRLCD